MISSRTLQKRLVLGAWLATLSILINAALHGSWAQEMPITGGLGGSFSICLAHGGSNGTEPADKGNSSDSANDHCELCVIPASSAVPASNTPSTNVEFRQTGNIDYGLDARLIVSRERDLQFDARAPPA